MEEEEHGECGGASGAIEDDFASGEGERVDFGCHCAVMVVWRKAGERFMSPQFVLLCCCNLELCGSRKCEVHVSMHDYNSPYTAP